MALNFFSSIATSLANKVSGLKRDFQQGLDAARECGVVIIPAADTFSGIEYDAGLIPSTGHDVGNEVSDDAMGAVRPGPQEGQFSPTDPSDVELLLTTAGQFAKFDIQMVAVSLEEFNDGNFSEESQIQTARSARHIQEMLGKDSHTQPWSKEEAMSIACKATEESGALSKNILLAELGALSESEFSTNNVVESRLHAGELLTQNIRQSLRAMFTALVSQLNCCEENHLIRLKLTGFVDQLDDESRPFFDLYLSTGDDCTRSYWVESKCTFIRELTRGEERCCSSIRKSILGKKKLSLLLKETCKKDPETQSTLAVESTLESLRPIQFNVSEESNSSITPIVSLASLMKQHESPYKIRRVSNAETFRPEDRDWLCLNLALSLLHMSGRDWNRAIWYSDNPNAKTGIFFLRDPSTQEIVDKRWSYMSWRLQEESRAQKPTKELRYDTQLFDFAKLLIEIHTWKRLDLKPKPTSQEKLRSSLLEYIDQNFREADFEFKSALEACLNQAAYVEAANEDKPERIQAYIFEKIVKPLHRYLGSPELPKSTFTAIISSDQAALDGSRQSENTTSIYDSSINDDKPEEKDPHEKTFWRNMEIFTEKYISPLQESTLSDDASPWPREKVRIAVIDSGVREEDPDIAAAEITKRIRDCRNFTSSDLNDCEDQIGHGTMVTRLLLTVAPEAELYIAKVSNQKTTPKNQLHRVAEAIKWAVLHWEIDIISISFALSEEHYDIDEELTQALSPSSRNAKSKLVFAAAGNRGAYESRAWPASKTGVIAVHATDWSGEGAKFNPNPESDLNISTLGKNIKMRWPDSANPGELKNVYISGSSFATPIAAGIAANVLEFARYRLKLNGFEKDRLYSHHGMMKILQAMSCPRGAYEFVHPLAFWEKAFKGGAWNGQELPRNNSENICKVLKSILG